MIFHNCPTDIIQLLVLSDNYLYLHIFYNFHIIFYRLKSRYVAYTREQEQKTTHPSPVLFPPELPPQDLTKNIKMQLNMPLKNSKLSENYKHNKSTTKKSAKQVEIVPQTTLGLRSAYLTTTFTYHQPQLIPCFHLKIVTPSTTLPLLLWSQRRIRIIRLMIFID